MLRVLDRGGSSRSSPRYLTHMSVPRSARLFVAESVGCRVVKALRYGFVAAVFNKACIVEMDGESIVSVLAQEAGQVAHGIRLREYGEFFRYTRVGVPAVLDDKGLTLGDGEASVIYGTAPVWRSRIRPRWENSNRCAGEGTEQLFQLLYSHAVNGGSDFLAATLVPGRRTTQLATRLSAVLPALTRATRMLDPDAVLVCLRHLIGLGPGLTPAGDDFVVGWLAGVTLAGGQCLERVRLRSIAAGIEALSSATTPVSRQHIADACAFEFSERLSDVCWALYERAPLPVLAAHLAAQLAVGATSGMDAAAGLAFALGCATPMQAHVGMSH